MRYLPVLAFLSLTKAQTDIKGIRLADGGNNHMGTVQVMTSSSEWTYICDDGFGFAEADAVCREVGFAGAERYTRNDQFRSIDPRARRLPPNFFPNILNCSEADKTYRTCPLATIAQQDCATAEVAGVVCRTSNSLCLPDQFPCRDNSGNCIARNSTCDGPRECLDGSDEAPELCTDMGVARLVSDVRVNIPGVSLGSVQVKHQEKWGVMCDDGISEKEAKVICRTLGYNDGWSAAFSGSYLGEAAGPMIVDSPKCLGSEQWLGQCPDINFGSSDCPVRGEDFGVFCYDEGVEVRLAGNASPDSGRVELKLGGKWGTVCDSGFDVFDAQVLCRMIGYDGDASAQRQSGLSSTELIWDLRLDCLGNEKNVQDCRIRVLNGTCPSTHTAGVTCSFSRGRVDAELRAALGNQDCGVSEDSSSQFLTRLARVRGGFPPSRFDTPWLVSLRRTNPRSESLLCGGTIISEDFVITAAHCLETAGRVNVVIRAGDYNSDFTEDSEQDYFIDKVWVHENEDEHGFNDNDVALIKIERKDGRGIRFGPRVKPVCLPSVYDDYAELRKCTVVGWGPTFFLDDPEVRPREAESDIISDYICEGSTGGPDNFTSSMMCVGRFNPRVNACKGDSGGPFTCPVNGRQTLYGMVSSGRACSFSASADLYVRVTKFVDWILEKVLSAQVRRF
ncbi:neurotrypsin-like [Macrobrachium rosenbergii]|uniref:neurotrypsin-like n=1 Tax=Macrobrachium rosenbergii TaxID=79674 RepID=UPI0034D43621